MKKLLFVLMSITLVVSCDIEPLDPSLLSNPDTGGGNGTPSEEPLALSSYTFDVDTTLPIFGTIIIDSDFTFNSNNKANTLLVNTTLLGQSTTENVVLSRDGSNRITGFRSTSSGVLTNETTVTYSGNDVSQIVYTFAEDAEEDYTYNFTYSANMITRTEVGTTISTVFTLDANGQLVKKESFDGTTSIKKEVLDYDGLGNCISAVITGEDVTASSFRFDNKINPLKDAFSDQAMLTYLNDDYEDSVGESMAQFTSPNNWIGTTVPEGSIDFGVAYDSEDRITTRTANYDFGDGVSIQQSEIFSFVN